MTHGQNLLDQRIQNDKITNNNIKQVETGQGEDYTTGCFLHYIFFKEHHKLIAIDLSKQRKLDTDPKMADVSFENV